MQIETTPQSVSKVYEASRKRLDIVRRRLGRPLTGAEKVMFGHLDDPEKQEFAPGKAMLALRPDRVALQDATAQMALLQFAQSRLPRTAVPTTVHCDHLIRAQVRAVEDLQTALSENREVYDFLSAAARKFGLGFWKPGSGIIHQVVLENYAFPGGLMIGTDSHTPNAGGLGMCAIGVGGADAVDVMAGLPWEVKHPRFVGVRLTGALSGWAAPKDVILWVCGKLTVSGGTDRIVEYFGPGARSISCTGKATITNMGAELGATCSFFPYDERMSTYLKATKRGEVDALAAKNGDLLRADEQVEADPGKYFDVVLDLDLSKLEPYVVGPGTPDLARPISKLAEDVRREGWPDALSAALIGSCTNSSYEDLSRVVDVAEQAAAAGVKAPVPFLVTPGSDQIHATVMRDGHVGSLEKVGATVMANACGPCIGQWKRETKGRNSILNSFNRNFPGRNDGSSETLSFIGSPEIVMALGLAGRLSFNPLKDELKPGVKLRAPGPAPEVPAKGFAAPLEGYVAPAADGGAVELKVDAASKRLQLLDPFPAWDGRDLVELPLLLKAKGKCTTDHISPAGTWLKFRGHLDNISDNMFLGAVNAFTGKPGEVGGRPVPAAAREYKAKGLRWIVVGDSNYGEGSSREHAAMSPRHLGAAAIVTRSFARIHETNLKKQGILPLTFADAADYDKVRDGDRISVLGLKELSPGTPLNGVLHHADGSKDEVRFRHSMTAEQIEWFRAGSALNLLKKRFSGGQGA